MDSKELVSSPSEHDSSKSLEIEDLCSPSSNYNGNVSMEVVDSLNVSTQSIEDLKYMQASNVNVANFVSVKLSSQIHYHVWKAQMLCLMESQLMRGIIDANFDSPDAKSVKFIKQYDSLLKGWIYGSLNEDVLKNVVGCESARDVWKKLEFFYDPKIDSTPPVSIIYPVVETTDVNLHYDTEHNAQQKTKLRKATEKGRWREAKCILKNNKDAATEVISRNGNTMLHLAVAKGHNYFLEKLLNFLDDGEQIEKKNSYGRTALHIAAIVDNKYAAELLVRKRKRLLQISDNAEYIPLLSAYYNMKLSTYVYLLEVSETEFLHLPLSRYPDARVQLIAVNFLITAIFTRQYDLASTLINIYPELVRRDDQVLMAIAISFPPKLSFREAFIYPSWNHAYENIVERSYLLFDSYNFLYNRAEDMIWKMRSFKNTYYSWLTDIVIILVAPIGVLYPIYQLIRLFTLVLLFPVFVLYFLIWKFLAIVAAPIKNVENKQKEYKNAKRILNFICDEIDASCSNATNHPYYSGPIFEAVRQDAYKVVQKILSRSYNIIDFKNQQGHNIIQLAVINRSEKVYNLFYPIIKHTESYSTMTDSSMNNLVHLAGRLAPSYVLTRTTGAALQLQRELQWREEVKKLMLPTDLLKENIYMEIPQMVFTREHANLVKEGEQWMKTTAESCSITAALIVTIVFAAAITVPGGSNQETGIPVFRKEIAFTIFAIADAISLFSAATSLLVFLSILTTRFSEMDFLVSLPRRLILGLCVLFISATAMMVAFCATLYLVFCDQRPWMLAPIGGLACLPIAVIATLQFPLVVDLFISTYFPIFHKKKFDFVESEILLRMDEE